MNFKKIQKIVTTALFMAIICVATLVIQIPSPATNGYFNLGDCFVLLAGWLLGPVYGMIASGVGSSLADAITGYVTYVPATLIIKALMAVIAYLIFKALKSKPLIGRVVGAVASECLMVLGYFAYEALILGYGMSAALSIPSNLMQGLVSVVASVTLATAISKVNTLNKLFN